MAASSPRRPPPPLSNPISHFTLAGLLWFLLLLCSAGLPSPAAAVNVTSLLSAHPELSGFNRLLTSSSVAADLTGRSSLTLLAVPDQFLLRSESELASLSDLADVLRYHVLLEYLSPSDLLRLPPAGKLVTTLFQTTGRAPSDLGAVNLTNSYNSNSNSYNSNSSSYNSNSSSYNSNSPSVVLVRSPAPFSPPSNATILGLVASLPYNVSVFAVDALLVPCGFDLAASSESRPPAGVNITRVLVEARGFNVAASMLEASGVAAEFEGDEGGAGITVFVPTDDAFAGLPATWRLQSLPAQQKAVVLRFHVLHSYYPLGSLESIVNPVQPTLATEDTGAGRFTLNISRVNGSVAIDTGLVQASITRTVFDQNPVAVFAVSRVLLPREIFGGGGGGKDPPAGAGPGAGAGAAPPPVEAAGMAPEAEGVDTSPAKVSSPPGLRGEIRSGAPARGGGGGGRRGFVSFCCTALVVYLLLVCDPTSLSSPS